MSGIPRRSVATSLGPNSQRRGSSTDGFGHRLSQAAGRASGPSIGGGLTGRPSSTGRPSMAGGGKGKPGESNQVNTLELSQTIIKALHDCSYPHEVTVKIMQLPSTATFYALFEFLLNSIGIEDVWDPAWLDAKMGSADEKGNNNKKGGKNDANNKGKSGVGGNGKALSAIEANKARTALIAQHLTLLRYQYVPKVAVLQMMTTPRNWSCMLEILAFLANNCEYMIIYGATKSLFEKDKGKEVFLQSLKDIYPHVRESGGSSTTSHNIDFMETEEYHEMKQSMLVKYQHITRNGLDLEQMQAKRENLRKENDILEASKNELDELLLEEQELMRKFDEEDRILARDAAKCDVDSRNVKQMRKAAAGNREKLSHAEKALAVRDAEYDKQVASGSQMENLTTKHANSTQELENAQNLLCELENKRDQLYSKLMEKTNEVKDTFAEVNDCLGKSKLSSSIPIEIFDLVELVDIHKRDGVDIAREYKDKIYKIREKYNIDICKLREEFLRAEEELKQMNRSKQTKKAELNELDRQNKHMENNLDKFKNRSSEDVLKLRKMLSEALEASKEEENRYEAKMSEVNELERAMNEDIEQQKKIEEHVQVEIKESSDTYTQNNEKYTILLEEREREKIELVNGEIRHIQELHEAIALLRLPAE